MAPTAGSSDPSAHDAMSITDATASSCSIVAGFAASTDTMASEPAERCASSPPGASANDGGSVSLRGSDGSVTLVGFSGSVSAGAAVDSVAVFVGLERKVTVAIRVAVGVLEPSVVVVPDRRSVSFVSADVDIDSIVYVVIFWVSGRVAVCVWRRTAVVPIEEEETV